MQVGLIWLISVLVVYIATLACIMLMEHRRPVSMTAWMFIALVVPFAGFVAYMMLGKDFTRRRLTSGLKHDEVREASHKSDAVKGSYDIGNEQLEQQQKLYEMLTGLAPFPITKQNQTTVLTNGNDTYDAILNYLNQAKHHIHLDYYTIRDDNVGRRFLQILVRKAKEGVAVRVIYDGIGSLHLTKEYIKELHTAGVRTCCFLPPRVAFYARRLNYRNHRKIAIIDGLVGFVGGINIGDEYIGMDPKLGFWRDTHLQLEGDAVYFLQELFMNDWAFVTKESLDRGKYMPPHRCKGNERTLIVSSKPGRNDHKILEVMFAAITAAKSRIYLTTPYFIPDASLVMSLRTAALSGVDVRIIIPDRPDSKLVLLSTLSYMQEMLDAGVRVFRYQTGFVHAKVMIIDHMLASVGTANMDMRSLYSNFELNAILFDKGAIERLEEDFMNDLHHSVELELQTFAKRPWKQKVAEAVLHILSPLL